MKLLMKEIPHQITKLLIDWSNGKPEAFDELVPLVYDELRMMARRFMRQQPLGHTFQTTELIHEAYLKLAGGDDKNWQNRAHFFGVASKAMRHILIDYARSKNREKRGGNAERLTLEDNVVATTTNRAEEIIALDNALKQLALLDERKNQVVEMKFFGGLTTEEIAEVLKISPETVKRDWSFSKTWLSRELAKI